MVCSECRTFKGNPTCGACRAVSRIVGLLRSGHFTDQEERRVIEVLRGAAGELTDLVEARLTQGSDQRSSPPRKEENTGLSSGPLPAQEERKTAAAVKEPSEYSYVTEAEESEKDEADDPEVEKNTETPK